MMINNLIKWALELVADMVIWSLAFLFMFIAGFILI